MFLLVKNKANFLFGEYHTLNSSWRFMEPFKSFLHTDLIYICI